MSELGELVWVNCPVCEKERQTKSLGGPEGLDELCICTACSMDMAKTEDHCPESMWVDENGRQGSSACRLTWHHQGRCEPWMSDEEFANAVEQLRGRRG